MRVVPLMTPSGSSLACLGRSGPRWLARIASCPHWPRHPVIAKCLVLVSVGWGIVTVIMFLVIVAVASLLVKFLTKSSWCEVVIARVPYGIVAHGHVILIGEATIHRLFKLLL